MAKRKGNKNKKENKKVDLDWEKLYLSIKELRESISDIKERKVRKRQIE